MKILFVNKIFYNKFYLKVIIIYFKIYFYNMEKLIFLSKGFFRISYKLIVWNLILDIILKIRIKC